MSFDLLSFETSGATCDIWLVRVDGRALLHYESWTDPESGNTRRRIGGALWMLF